MLFKLNIKLSEPYYDDLPPEDKSPEKLGIFILMDADGLRSGIKKYNRSDINTCARRLIYDGYLRGTIISHTECVWSKLTRKGRFLEDNLKKCLNISVIVNIFIIFFGCNCL